ncbi:gephyrin-like molybdotransferase Glp [Neotabrizicola sp. VNH66]|uniref:molybdopterin molybdotransferase MoeA n=1 Tax=Neotabrizicola sp. VNH66 TaxID=3400918 RepID=UPI003BFF79BE
MIPVEEATRRLLALAGPLPAENVPLAQAAGRWMAGPVTARRDQPPFDASAMDGYAVFGPAPAGASFRVVGEAGAGHAFPGSVSPGDCIRIFTGAPLPPGTDRVVIQENVRRDGDRITVLEEERATHVRVRGQDFAEGAALAPRRLRPADLALIAAMNVPQVPVARRPVVALIGTGDELVQPGEDPRPDQIVASNAFALKALAEGEGAEVRVLPVARDNEPALRTVLALAEGADVVVTIGGASVGDHDLVGRVLAAEGMDFAFWKIALRPGKPLMAGRLRGAVVLGLPGNPVSAIVCGHLFLLPLLRHLQGDPAPLPRLRPARAGADLAENGPRSHYMRARLSEDGTTLTPFGPQDSALLTLLTEADALLLRPAGDVARKAGDPVTYLPL